MASDNDKKRPGVKSLRSVFGRAVRYAQAAILWERTWPRLAATATVGGLFLSASWLGLWGTLSPEGRMAGVALFAAGALIAPFLVRSGSLFVSRKEAVVRIDRRIDDPERPAHVLEDELLSSSTAADRVLFDEYQRKVETKWADKLKGGVPHPRLSQYDPFRLRFAVVALTLASAALAGSERLPRLQQAFQWHTPPVTVETQPLRIDAWVTPPAYTKKEPLYLTRGGYTGQESMPEGSILTILAGNGPVAITRASGAALPEPKLMAASDPRKEGASAQYDIPLTTKDSCFAIKDGPQWCFTITEDKPPVVTLDGAEASKTAPGSLELSCKAQDDFGVDAAEVIIEPAGGNKAGAKPLSNAQFPSAPLRGGPQGPCGPR